MSIQEVSPEQLAELFHHYYQADFGCASTSSNEAWERVPQQEKNRLVAAARLALLELSSKENKKDDSQRYFAKPGNAEWGC